MTTVRLLNSSGWSVAKTDIEVSSPEEAMALLKSPHHWQEILGQPPAVRPGFAKPGCGVNIERAMFKLESGALPQCARTPSGFTELNDYSFAIWQRIKSER